MNLIEIYEFLMKLDDPIVDKSMYTGLADSLWFQSKTAPGHGLLESNIIDLIEKGRRNDITIPSNRTEKMLEMRKELFKNEINIQKIIELTKQIGI